MTFAVYVNEFDAKIATLIYPGNGDGTLGTPFLIPFTPPFFPGYIGSAAGDFNGDGRLDIAELVNNHVIVFLNEGAGVMQPAANLPAPGGIAIAAGRVLGNNEDDLVISSEAVQVSLASLQCFQR